ncbi:MAG: hypothetical protein JNK82_18475 [Myxococcaceae bacterium]|nr:hypothetical protein [Myxococcaceae bacterium]
MRRVVVTGMGLVTPLGSGVEHVWRRLLEGESGIRRIEGLDVEDLPAQIAGVVPRGTTAGDLNLDALFDVKERRRLEDFLVYAIAAAVEAIFSVLALRVQVAPPTLNLHEPEGAAGLDLVPLAAKRRPMRHVLSNSFGFGGTNASRVLSRA